MNWRRYVVYHGRWQLSTVVMMGPMIVLGWIDVPRWLSLIIVQFIGACIFYYVDRHIFRRK